MNLCERTDSADTYAGVHKHTFNCTILCRRVQEEPSIKEVPLMVDDYVVIFTPYITRKGVRVWASQYGLKAFCLRIPREKYRG